MATGTVILKRVATLLQDDDHIRWPCEELVDWINEGTRAICLAKPSASSVTIPIELQAGTMQVVPSTGEPRPASLLRIVRNLKSIEPRAGGRTISPTSQALLDANEPYWHDETVVRFKSEVRQFVFSDDDPMTFYVYPGNDGTGIVEAVLATLPSPLVVTGGADTALRASYGDEINLNDVYSVPLVDFVCYRAQSKDDVSGNGSRANYHYGQFASAMGIKVQTSMLMSPARQNDRG